MKKNEQPDLTHELRDPEVPVVRGSCADSGDTICHGAQNTPAQPHN